MLLQGSLILAPALWGLYVGRLLSTKNRKKNKTPEVEATDTTGLFSDSP